jgi:hypothetical protein
MYILTTGPYISGLITPAVEAATMSVNVWLPFIVAIAVYTSMLLVILLIMPETKQKLEPSQEEPLTPEPDETCSNSEGSEALPSVLGPVATMLKIPNLAICFGLFFIKRTSFMSENLFYQHASTKFDLELRQTPWFRSVKSAGGIFVLSLVLPTITTFFRSRGARSQAIDLKVIRGSLVAMVIAFFAVYIAPSPWIFAAGKSQISNRSGHGPLTNLLNSCASLRCWRWDRSWDSRTCIDLCCRCP